jgi:hypothetical protein
LCVQIDRITRANGFMVGMANKSYNNISAIYALMTICTVYGCDTAGHDAQAAARYLGRH